MIKNINNKAWLSTSEVAKIVGVNRVTVFRWVRDGHIAADKVGKTYLISREALDSYLGKENLTETRKQEIDQNVDLIFKEYGQALKLLGDE
ncbi:helix-turn-helix domain-containing protein [Patescibacteria group bacterium]|nr:helix-turn-helix domain-containing protein [Patescibacteria group bacterium]